MLLSTVTRLHYYGSTVRQSIRAAFAGSNATAPFMATRKQRENENEVSDRYGLQRYGPTKAFIPVISCLLKI